MTLSLAILSTAHNHSDAYADALTRIDDADLVAVADEDPDRGQSFADDHDVEYASREAVLDRVDAAVVTAANADHRQWVEASAAAGVDVLCEKPLATTTEDAEAMVDACEEAGVSLGVAMPVRFCEPARRAKAAVESGDLGDLQAIVGTNLLQWTSGGSWMTDPAKSGGGAIMDHTVHVVDLARWITGQEVTEVFTETGTMFADVPVEDVVVCSMTMEDGTALTHDGSWRQPDTWDFWGDVTMRLIGTESVVEIDCFDQTLTRTTGSDAEGPGIDSVYWGEDMNEGLLRDFVSAVREGRDPAITGREGAREVRVVEAAYESGDRVEPVGIEYSESE
jgi:predicted dehydrogenase